MNVRLNTKKIKKGLTVHILAHIMCSHFDAGWSSLVARRAHNPKVVGSNPAPATNFEDRLCGLFSF